VANLSKIKRERMLEFLESLKAEHTDDKSIRAFTEIENQLRDKKYGLVWEEHTEHVDKMLEDNIPIFTEDKDRKIVSSADDTYNFLLEGDNLQCLYLLEKTHMGAVDIIYIDPPYNTGNKDFIYNDCYIESEDSYKHSKWISFIEKRIKIAYRLLSKDGIMFVSIDDNEMFDLKLLLDEIFSEENFIIALPRITKKSGKTTGSFSRNHDYVLVYVKENKNIFKMEEHTDPAFSYEDEWVSERGKYKLNQTLDYDSLSYSASLDYPLTVEGKTFYPGGNIEDWKKRQQGNHKRADWAWRWNQKLFDFGYKNGFVVIKRKDDGSARIYTKTYLNATIKKESGDHYSIEYKIRTKPLSSIGLTENIYSNDNAKKDLKPFGLQDEFDYSKPVELIKRLIKNHFNKNAIILDFFAGSGTTAQAVMELNIEDGGHRRFIICTNNQNKICDNVTYPRCKGVITTYAYNKADKTELLCEKIKVSDLNNSSLYDKIAEVKNEHKAEYKKFTTEIKNEFVYLYGVTIYKQLAGLPYNMKYYRCDWTPRKPEDYLLSNALCLHIREMIELQNGIEVDQKKNILILNMDDFKKTVGNPEIYAQAENIWINQNMILGAEELELLSAKGYKYIPKEFFGQELKEAAE
jgi:adenine-specific DNA-methyltransferase